MAITHILISNFFQMLALFWAIHAQWSIQKEYNISLEILLITIVWVFIGQVIPAAYIGTKWLMFRLWANPTVFIQPNIPIDQLRWYI